MWNPINRTTVQTEENKFRIYPKQGPLFYKTVQGTFDTIDHTFNDTTSSIGDISLMNKGIVSVGKRKGNNPTKVVGIRPDSNQHLGTQQLEFSLVNVELDNVSQSFNVETDLEIQLKAAKVFQLVKLNKSFSNCKIEFDIHAKNIELVNTKYENTTTLCDYNFSLTNLGEIDTSTTSLNRNNFHTSKSTDIPCFDFYISQITNDYITTGEYSVEEEFGDSDLSNYTLDNDFYSRGGSIYYKDSIILVVKSYNIENSEDIIVNQFCNAYGLETIFEDNQNGQYFTKNGKKVGSYFTYDYNTFYVMFNTKAIPDSIKTLFKRKTFNDTSFLDITLTDFSNTINTLFNKDLKIEVDNNYYSGDYFQFKINNESYFIKHPIAFDENYNDLKYHTTHTLKDNADGSYRYTKYLKPESALNINTAKYLDATLAIGNTSDGALYWTPAVSGPAATLKNNGQFDDAREESGSGGTAPVIANDASAGPGSNQEIILAGDQSFSTRTSGQIQITSLFFRMHQTHLNFDTSGISDEVTSATFKFKGGFSDNRNCNSSGTGGDETDCSIIALKSLVSGSGVHADDDFNNFVGHVGGNQYSWDSDDVTEYSGDTVIDGYHARSQNDVVPGSLVDETLTFNSTARTDIQNDDLFKFCIIDFDQWYNNSYDNSYGESTVNNGPQENRLVWMLQVDDATTSNRPFLEYEVASSGYGNVVMGVASANITSINGIATANISKVNGA